MTIKKPETGPARKSASALALLSALFLAGCVADGAEFDDNYVSANHEERYPITVKEAPVKMNVSAKAGSLRADDLNRVINFAQDARGNASSRVGVHYASGSSHSRKVAHQAVEVLVDQGVPRGMISVASYKGSASVVQLSFRRKVAVTKECGDWSENLANHMYNEPYPNQGCAMQHNIAAMVANPEDFEAPRAMPPAGAASRSAAIKKYNTGEAINSSSSSSGSGSTTTTGSN